MNEWKGQYGSQRRWKWRIFNIHLISIVSDNDSSASVNFAVHNFTNIARSKIQNIGRYVIWVLNVFSLSLMDATSSSVDTTHCKAVEENCTGEIFARAIGDRNMSMCALFLWFRVVLAVTSLHTRVCRIDAAISTDHDADSFASGLHTLFFKRLFHYFFSIRSNFLWRNFTTCFDVCSFSSYNDAVFIFTSWVYCKMTTSRARCIQYNLIRWNVLML